MKFSSTLTSIVFATCSLAGVRAAENDLTARYCLLDPPFCVLLNPVPINECTTLQHQGIVALFEANVSCVLFKEVDCTGESMPVTQGEINHPGFFAGSFSCSPP